MSSDAQKPDDSMQKWSDPKLHDELRRDIAGEYFSSIAYKLAVISEALARLLERGEE